MPPEYNCPMDKNWNIGRFSRFWQILRRPHNFPPGLARVPLIGEKCKLLFFCSYFSQGAIILGSKPNLKLAKKYKKVFPPTMMLIVYIKQQLFHSDVLSQLHGLFIGNTPAVAITDFSLAKELFSRRAPSQVQLLTFLFDPISAGNLPESLPLSATITNQHHDHYPQFYQ